MSSTKRQILAAIKYLCEKKPEKYFRKFVDGRIIVYEKVSIIRGGRFFPFWSKMQEVEL